MNDKLRILLNEEEEQGAQGINFLDASLKFYADLWHPEQKGFALSFDGNDVATYTVGGFRSSDSSGTIEIWFRTTTTPAVAGVLASSADTSTDTVRLFVFINASGQLAILQNNDDTQAQVRGGTNVVDGKWHHAIFSSSGTAWSIILDGVSETITVVSGSNNGDWFADTNTYGRNNLTLGEYVGLTPTYYFTGVIGFTRIYSRAMLAPEALTNYQRGRKATASNTTGLVLNLPLTEGTGNPVDTVIPATFVLTGATWIESLMDRSTNAYPISLFGSPVQTNQGRTLALNKYGIVTAPALNYTSGDFSGWAWIKTTDLTTNNTIISRGLASTDGWFFRVHSDGNIGIVTNQAAAFQLSSSGAGAVVTGTWYLLGFSRAGAVGKVWKNVGGVMADVTTVSGSHTNPLTSTRTLKIGVYDDLLLPLIGTMGEADVTGRNILQAEFQQIFNATRQRYGV